MGQRKKDEEFDEFDGEDIRKSKTQRKREMIELQALGEKLCAMPNEKIKAMDIPEAIREAALFDKTVKKHEAKRRHRQHLGKLMRAEADNIDALREAMEYVDQKKHQNDDRFHQLEEWRERLMDGDDELIEEIVAANPEADRQRLRTLARNAAGERKANKPPKAFRILFKYLREVSGQ
ncbi:ribosome biogenesis factor YjgA [Desulfovibrio ferrophilus]|uniref:UPF0307 protein PSJM300_03775 n=1 Tax=Desulfovibrio ferrophilus TaxID=241368 RepID=A0A2Z6AZI9_9BACT|nr:ribosome biogenesis factor YjgA [Desulfovibrio ferrophilus]BBD08610.1 UPF0307 protein PSJM300_03775 [Desulfovibrio ferrophilus]